MNTIILDKTTSILKAKLGGAITTNQPTFICGYADSTASAFTEGANVGELNGVNEVSLVAAPASSTRRVIKSISVYNKDTVAVTLTIFYDDNNTDVEVAKITLQPDEVWTLNGTFTSDGKLKMTTGYVGYVDTTGAPVAGDFAKFTDANSIEGRDLSEMLADLKLDDFPGIGFVLVGKDVDASTGEKIKFDFLADFRLLRVYVSAGVAPTGASLQVDVEDEGASVLNAVVSVAIGTNNGETSSFSGATSYYDFSKGDCCTIDIDQKGSTDPGQEVYCLLIGVPL